MKVYFFLFIFIIHGQLIGKTEIIILSKNVGTEIDIHENRYYRIFPNEKGFINAQINKINNDQYRLLIVKRIKNKKTKVRRYINQNELNQLQLHVNQQPPFTEEAKFAMYAGMDFLRAEKIVNDIPKPQYVELKHSGNKKLKGTLYKVEDKSLFIQTANIIEKISLYDLDQISYRTTFGKYEKYRIYMYALTSVLGLVIANEYNIQRPVGLNEYNIPRKDIVVYRQLIGIVSGLLFSSEVFDAISTLLTSSDTIILSEAEFERKNFK